MIFRLILVLCLSCQSCTWEKEKLVPQPEVCNIDSNITYASGISQIITTNCLNRNCHITSTTGGVNPIGTDWSDSTQLRTFITNAGQEFLKKIEQNDAGVSAPYMPLGFPKMTDCEINKIKFWINRGMP